MRRRDVLKLAVLSAGAVLAQAALLQSACAQDRYPSRPVRLYVPATPGGVHDVIGRVWAEKIKPTFGTIIIENRGGGGGTIAAAEVAHAQPDGYSLLMGSTTTHVLVPPTMANPPYDPAKGFAPISVVGYSATSIVVHPSVPARTLMELIAYVKANPGKLSYGSAGNGTMTNLAGELFKQLAGGLDIVHIPYKGIGQVSGDLIGGQIPIMSAGATAHVVDLHRSGRARILSVHSQARLKNAPEIPTSIEAGLPGMLAQTTFATFAPAGTPRPILDKVDQLTQQALADEQFQNEMLKLGFEPARGIGPEGASAAFQEERTRWMSILKTIGGPPG